MLIFRSAVPWSPVFDNTEDTVSGNADDTLKGGSGNDTLTGGTGDDDKPTLTQKQVNAIVAQERRKAQAENEKQVQKQVQELRRLQQEAGVTQKVKDDLEAKIQELSSSLLTKEEQAKREKERLEKDHKTKLTQTEQERDLWKKRFTDSQIEIEIRRAAKEEKGFSEDQFVRHLAPDASLVEILDEEGKSTGKFTTKVQVLGTKDDKPITLSLTAIEAVKRMKDQPEFANFFESGTAGGLGAGRPTSPRSPKDVAKMTPLEYREFIKKEREKAGRR